MAMRAKCHGYEHLAHFDVDVVFSNYLIIK